MAQKTQNGVIITDAQGCIEWVNEAFTRISGYVLEEMQGKKPGDVLQGPQTDPLTIAQLRSALDTGETLRSGKFIITGRMERVIGWRFSIAPNFIEGRGNSKVFIGGAK